MSKEKDIQTAARDFMNQYPDDIYVRHYTVLFLNSTGTMKQKEIAQLSGYTTRQVYNIEQMGPNSLKASAHKGGRKAIFDDSDNFSALLEVVVSHPEGSQQEKADILREKYDVNVSPQTIDRTLARNGLSELSELVEKKIADVIAQYQPIQTRFAGAFLLIPLLLKQKFGETCQTAFAGLQHIISVMLLLLMLQIFSIRRLFHLEHLSDRGFALLTGRKTIFSRQFIHSWVKQTRIPHVDTFYEATRVPKPEIVGQALDVSFDEHVVARWTESVDISGTKHPTRGKAMKADKLFYAFDLGRKKLLSYLPQKGNRTLAQMTLPMVKELIARYEPSEVRLLLDAGGCKGSTIARLVTMSQRLKQDVSVPLTFYVRGKAYPNHKKEWVNHIAQHPLEKVIHPEDETKPVEKQRQFYVGETTTKINGCATPLRTVLTAHCPDAGGEKADDLYVIYTNDDGPPKQTVALFRTRQNHELCYRVMVHDLNLDALPKSYSTASNTKDGKKANFLSKRIKLMGWIKAYAFNIMQDFKKELPKKYHKMTAGTIMMKFLRKNAIIHLSQEQIVVHFDYFKEQEALKKYIQQCNQQEIKIPWLNDRKLLFKLTEKSEISFEYG